MTKRKMFGLFLVFISLIFLIISFGYLISWYQDSRESKAIMDSLRLTPKKEISNSDLPEFLYNPPADLNDIYYKYLAVPFLSVDFTELLKQNSDTIGWLNVEGTSIDSVFVKTTNNTYYLDHSFNKKSNQAGWIFSDYRNDFDTLNDNTIIYGHRRLDGAMFGPLINVLKESWLNNPDNHIIKISTLNNNYIFEVVSVYTISKESYYITSNFALNSSFTEFLNTIQKRSIHDFSASLNAQDKILTLSTCYDNNGKRLVLHAKLIKKETR